MQARSPLAKVPPYANLILPLFFAIVVVVFGQNALREAFEFPAQEDFAYIRAGADIVTTDKPYALYRTEEYYYTWYDMYGYNFPGAYAYPPAFAFATVPLNEFSEKDAFDIWQGIVALAMLIIAAGLASSFKSWPWRIAVVVAVIFSEIMLLSVKIGQTGALVAAITCVGFLLYIRKRELGALVLGLLILKPPTLIGPALAIFPEKARVWAFFAAPILILGLVPFLFLGVDSIGDWLQLLLDRSKAEVGDTTKYNQGLSDLSIGTGLALIAMGIVLPLVALGINKVMEQDGIEVSSALALLLGLLFNPHSLLYEWGVGFVVIMLLRRAKNFGALSTDLGAGLLVITLFLAGQLTWYWRFDNPPLQPLTIWGTALVLGLGIAIFQRWRAAEGTASPPKAAPLAGESP